MRLSEAIREGARRSAPHRYWFHNDARTATCALGAALLAEVGVDATMDAAAVVDHWPATARITGYDGPLEAPKESVSLLNTIACANDQGATREEIADWVQWLEDGGVL